MLGIFQLGATTWAAVMLGPDLDLDDRHRTSISFNVLVLLRAWILAAVIYLACGFGRASNTHEVAYIGRYAIACLVASELQRRGYGD